MNDSMTQIKDSTGNPAPLIQIDGLAFSLTITRGSIAWGWASTV